MQKRIFLGVFLMSLACVAVANTVRRPASPKAVVSPSFVQWEHAVFRVRGSDYEYEWQDANSRVFADRQKVFLEKLKLSHILWKLEKMHTESSPPFPDEVVEMALINYWGAEGWELTEVFRGVRQRYYWFKRRLR